MELKNIAKNYFNAFQDKNLNALSEMFDDSVTLKDWNINVLGKAAVLNANKEIFDSLNTICVDIKMIYLYENTIIAELDITVDKQPEKLPVVDIITFNKMNKIKSIVAYRGN